MIRILDIIFSLLGIIILTPLFIIVHIIIRVGSKGKGVYTQIRVGKNEKDFKIYKFRTMSIDSDINGGLLTVGKHDTRITKVGYYLRKYKIDELPQLYNVLIGDMSLVGPRPLVRESISSYTKEQRKIFSIRPGITDYASIKYFDESEFLSNSNNPVDTYVEHILPDKIRNNMKYINNRTVAEYFKIIFITFGVITKRIIGKI